MRIVKAAALALAGIFAVTTAEAAPLVSKPVTESVIGFVQAKKDEKAAPKKAAPKKAEAKKAAPKKKAAAKKASSKAGKCGTGNYWDKKAKKCVAAADKK